MPPLQLHQLRPGERARIVRLNGNGPVLQRLHEMGLVEDVLVRMVRTAPLGDPLEFELEDYHLSLRKAEAARVEVERA